MSKSRGVCPNGCEDFYLPSIVLMHEQVRHFKALCKARGVNLSVRVAELIRRDLKEHPLHPRELRS